jgi:hypothetical protein
MGRRNVQGEDVPWPFTKTLGNSEIPASAARCYSRFGALTEPRTQSIIHPCTGNRIASLRRRGARCSAIRRKLGGFVITLRASTSHYRDCWRAAQSLPSYKSVRSATATKIAHSIEFFVPGRLRTTPTLAKALAPSIVQTHAQNQVAEASIRSKRIEFRIEFYKESKGDSLV